METQALLQERKTLEERYTPKHLTKNKRKYLLFYYRRAHHSDHVNPQHQAKRISRNTTVK